MENKTNIRQTNFKNLKDLVEEEKFDFQKAYEKKINMGKYCPKCGSRNLDTCLDEPNDNYCLDCCNIF